MTTLTRKGCEMRGLFFLLAALIVVSCKPLNTVDSRPEFAVDTQAKSIMLKNLSETGNIKYCIGFVDSDVDSNITNTFKEGVQNAVKDWNDLLVGMENPAWPQNEITVDFLGDEKGRCKKHQGALKILVWQKLGGNVAWEAGTGTCQSPACGNGKALEVYYNLSHSIYKRFGLEYSIKFLILHEYGHILMLGDTYFTPDLSEPSDEQPMSIMQSSYNDPGLTDDDKAGVRAAWSYTVTGTFECGAGYQTEKVPVNYWNWKFCIPVKKLEDENISIINEDAKFSAVLKNSEEAKVFFDNIKLEEIVISGNHVKTFTTTQNPGDQSLTFSCQKDASEIYSCNLNVSKKGKAYKIHKASDGTDFFVVRNDTDYSEPAKVLFDLFPAIPKNKVTSGRDAVAGVTIVGGNQLLLPGEVQEASFKLMARNDGAKYFSMFILKIP